MTAPNSHESVDILYCCCKKNLELQYDSLPFQSRSAQLWVFIFRKTICGNQGIAYPIPLSIFLVSHESRHDLENLPNHILELQRTYNRRYGGGNDGLFGSFLKN